MAPITAAELAAVCRAADPETVAGFVAALYEARGRTVERAAGVGDHDEATDAASFTLVGRDGRRRVVVPAGRTVPPGADAVVVAGRTVDVPDGLRVIDAAGLRDALCYAVDRETADRLLERWFDRPLSSFEGSAGATLAEVADENGTVTARESGSASTDSPERAGPDRSSAGGDPPSADADAPGSSGNDAPTSPGDEEGGGPRPTAAGDGGDGNAGPETETVTGDRRPATLAAGALAVLFVAAAVVGLAVGLPPGFGPGNATGTATGTLAPASSPTETPVPESSFDAQGPGLPQGPDTAPAPGGERTASARLTQLPNFMSALPPGVDRNGIADYRELVEANREHLEGNSYRLTLVYRELVDGTTTGVSTQIVRVENATHYRASEMRFGEFASSPPRLFDRDAYADGTVRFERTADGVRRSPATGADRFLDRLSQYLGWYLSVEESWIADREAGRTTTTLRLASEGDPWPGVANATGDAIVTDSGQVRVVRREYDDPDSGVHVVVTVRVSDVGRTVVARPSWVPDPDSSPA